MNKLSGAVIYVLNGNDAIVASRATSTIRTVASLGGRVASRLEDATHALWIDHDDGDDEEGSDHTEDVRCSLAQTLSVPVLDAERWLRRVSELRPTAPHNEHWSEIDCADYAPPARRPRHRRHRRRRDVASLEASLSGTLEELSLENPNLADEHALRRAVELSLRDFALVARRASSSSSSNDDGEDDDPRRVLGVSSTASPAEIRGAYRRLARVHHPDKGGSAAAFGRVARAYRALLVAPRADDPAATTTTTTTRRALRRDAARWDEELRAHDELVRELFARRNDDDPAARAAARDALLRALGLVAREAGSTAVNERRETVRNSCFYLSLAASWLTGAGAIDATSVGVDDDGPAATTTTTTRDREGDREEDLSLLRHTASALRRSIESAVVAAHPEWAAAGRVGDHVQAFADFLVYSLDSPDSIVSDWAVVVFDASSGLCDVYKGSRHDDESDSQASNVLTVQYTPGHYRPLLLADPHGERPTLRRILEEADRRKVLYVVTDGAA